MFLWKRIQLMTGIILLFTCLTFQSCNSGKSDDHQAYDIAAFYWPDYHDDPRLEFIFSDKKGGMANDLQC